MNVDTLNESIGEINKRSDEITSKLLERIRKIKEALKPVTDFLKPIAEWLWNNKVIILEIVGAFLLVKTAVDKVIGVFATFAGIKLVISAIAGAVGGLISIIGTLIATGAIIPVLIGVLIGLVAYSAYWTIKHWDEVKTRFEEIWESIKETFVYFRLKS